MITGARAAAVVVVLFLCGASAAPPELVPRDLELDLEEIRAEKLVHFVMLRFGDHWILAGWTPSIGECRVALGPAAADWQARLGRLPDATHCLPSSASSRPP